ncbi:MAG: cation diffusion facilitator family transporter [Myxococcota bacterium]
MSVHEHHHGHHHLHAKDRGRRALLGALLLNGGFLVIEAAVGLWTGSLALLSDAAHMLGDVGALSVALFAAQLAQQPSNPTQTFGLRRAEVLGGLFNGVTMLLICGAIVWEAVSRIFNGPPEMAGTPIFIVGGIGLAINLGSAWMLWKTDRDNLNIRGALVHMLADALGSLGAMIAALLVAGGLPAADTIVSIVIAGLILVSTGQLLWDAGRVLMQLPPPTFDVNQAMSVILEDHAVLGVHGLHVWSLDGETVILTAHLVIGDAEDSIHARCRVEQALRQQLNISHVTLQIERIDEPQCLSAGSGVCDEKRVVDHRGHHRVHHHAQGAK